MLRYTPTREKSGDQTLYFRAPMGTSAPRKRRATMLRYTPTREKSGDQTIL